MGLGHDAWETALKLAKETLVAWGKIVDLDESVLKKKPNVKRLDENVKYTQEMIGLANKINEIVIAGGNYKEICKVCEELSNEGNFAGVRQCYTGGEKEMYE